MRVLAEKKIADAREIFTLPPKKTNKQTIPGFLQEKIELCLQSVEKVVWIRKGRRQCRGEGREQSNFP